ncbi:cytochrome c5 family protein [Ramlibacter monticola]|uniref:Cytochrome c5 family protein n=1 Tax=Ramlibacter monticola TaxID=1926872 RepID=A0A937CVV7_9BURK|nr:cytochrome c5 family protein [Ramlibacter monticola]
MKKLTLAATALAVAAVLTGCGRHDDDAATTASTSSSPSTSAPSSSDNNASLATAPSSSDSSSANVASTPSTTGSSGSLASSSSATGSSMDAGASNTAAMGAGGSGQTVYSSTCAMCHAAGVTGAPKPGDKDDWKPRIAQGKDTLYKHALGGFQGKKGTMPPKGGNTSLPDADVKAAVDFMVDQSK